MNIKLVNEVVELQSQIISMENQVKEMDARVLQNEAEAQQVLDEAKRLVAVNAAKNEGIKKEIAGLAERIKDTCGHHGYHRVPTA